MVLLEQSYKQVHQRRLTSTGATDDSRVAKVEFVWREVVGDARGRGEFHQGRDFASEYRTEKWMPWVAGANRPQRIRSARFAVDARYLRSAVRLLPGSVVKKLHQPIDLTRHGVAIGTQRTRQHPAALAFGGVGPMPRMDMA